MALEFRIFENFREFSGFVASAVSAEGLGAADYRFFCQHLSETFFNYTFWHDSLVVYV